LASTEAIVPLASLLRAMVIKVTVIAAVAAAAVVVVVWPSIVRVSHFLQIFLTAFFF
jgi:hypothetical protein